MKTSPFPMNAKERMRLAMRGENPDRVPVMCQLGACDRFLIVAGKCLCLCQHGLEY